MGAIAPQRRISKTRKRQRRSHMRLDNPSMMVCPNCGNIKLAHVACDSCGYYNGELVKPIKVKEEEKVEAVEKETKKAKKTAKNEVAEEVKENKEVKVKRAKKVVEDK